MKNNATIASWNRIQNKTKEMEKFFNYPMKSMLLHYILCTVNGSLNYKITGLSDEFRLIKATFGTGKCPTYKELKACASEQEAIERVDTYYSNYFLGEYEEYIQKLYSILE